MMKITRSFLPALLLFGSVGAGSSFAAAEGVISNSVLVPGSYCHLTFPAIREDTLASDRPVLKDPSSGDIIDFYGSCDTDPLGEDQVQQQRLERQRRWQRAYND
jgi:hypothetical protein